eukprot:gnl/Carplike_NY0171/3432_a4631_288.p1 GENE.gnl/Carplike_NY0171/3432_a4631_288~~gnl/Carplike_NY0171/3432_a4631_288.p1  ORF type:complete len:696 (-),score=125.54 gnl/Carplike_NY0171/3432_a4631_288:135-2222(-)
MELTKDQSIDDWPKQTSCCRSKCLSLIPNEQRAAILYILSKITDLTTAREFVRSKIIQLAFVGSDASCTVCYSAIKIIMKCSNDKIRLAVRHKRDFLNSNISDSSPSTSISPPEKYIADFPKSPQKSVQTPPKNCYKPDHIHNSLPTEPPSKVTPQPKFPVLIYNSIAKHLSKKHKQYYLPDGFPISRLYQTVIHDLPLSVSFPYPTFLDFINTYFPYIRSTHTVHTSRGRSILSACTHGDYVPAAPYNSLLLSSKDIPLHYQPWNPVPSSYTEESSHVQSKDELERDKRTLESSKALSITINPGSAPENTTFVTSSLKEEEVESANKPSESETDDIMTETVLTPPAVLGSYEQSHKKFHADLKVPQGPERCQYPVISTPIGINYLMVPRTGLKGSQGQPEYVFLDQRTLPHPQLVTSYVPVMPSVHLGKRRICPFNNMYPREFLLTHQSMMNPLSVIGSGKRQSLTTSSSSALSCPDDKAIKSTGEDIEQSKSDDIMSSVTSSPLDDPSSCVNSWVDSHFVRKQHLFHPHLPTIPSSAAAKSSTNPASCPSASAPSSVGSAIDGAKNMATVQQPCLVMPLFTSLPVPVFSNAHSADIHASQLRVPSFEYARRYRHFQQIRSVLKQNKKKILASAVDKGFGGKGNPRKSIDRFAKSEHNAGKPISCASITSIPHQENQQLVMNSHVLPLDGIPEK